MTTPEHPELNAKLVKTEHLEINYRLGDEVLFSDLQDLDRTEIVLESDQIALSQERIRSEIENQESVAEDILGVARSTRNLVRIVSGALAVGSVTSALLGVEPSTSVGVGAFSVLIYGLGETKYRQETKTGYNSEIIKKAQGKIALLKTLLPNGDKVTELK